jgi:hypothetical protein
MSSLTSHTKQIPANSGYYINVADCRTTVYANSGTDSAPTMIANVYAVSSVTSTFMATAGNAVFKDMGKTLVSSGRTFRKVQLVVSTGLVTAGGSGGVGGVDNAPVNYLTGYIELPGQHGSGSVARATPVARLG